jgi:hypothetical protein
MDTLKSHFISNMRKGVLLSSKELPHFAKLKKLSVGKKELRNFRNQWKFSAMFSKPMPVQHYMSSALPPRLGSIMIDYAYFHDTPTSRRANNGYGGIFYTSFPNCTIYHFCFNV